MSLSTGNFETHNHALKLSQENGNGVYKLNFDLTIKAVDGALDDLAIAPDVRLTLITLNRLTC